MRQVKQERVLAAVERLGTVDLPKAGALIPGLFALIRAGIQTGDEWTAIPPTAFVDLCEAYFKVPNPPRPDKPYFWPLQGTWRATNWPRGSIFTRFKDLTPLAQEGYLENRGEGQNYEWRLKPGYETVLKEYVLPERRIPIGEFAVWVFRHNLYDEDKTLGQMVTSLRNELRGLTEAAFDALFDSTVPDPDEIVTGDEWDIAALTKHLPPPDTEPPRPRAARTEAPGEAVEVEEELAETIPPPTDTELIAAVMRHVRDEAKMEVAPDLIPNLLESVRTDRFAILVGKSGSGKTEFARAFIKGVRHALEGIVHVWPTEIEISDQFAEHDLLGFRDLTGQYVPSTLIRDLRRGDPDNDVYFVLLDECNLGSLDEYAGKFLAAVKSGLAIDLPGTVADGSVPASGKWLPPPGAFVIGTMNSYLEDPSRKMLSTPVKRRANIIQMTNPLEEMAASAKNDEAAARARFSRTCRLLLDQAIDRLRRRASGALEGDRIGRLSAPIPDAVEDVLWAVSKVLAPRSDVPMTLGPIQNILEYVQGAGTDPVAALDLQLTQKLIPLLRGGEEVLDLIEDCLDDRFALAKKRLGELRLLTQENQGRIRPLV
ncbi:MAG: hypothetical protein HY332_23395 [Chloroflexi bacterium]|nr:hypothetical protein [Chloroflexota bacterium]